MLQLIAFMSFLAFTTTVYLLLAQMTSKRRLVLQRLQMVVSFSPGGDFDDQVLSQPFIERVWQPLFRRLLKFLGSLAPQSWKARATEKLVAAGNPWNMDPSSFVALQVFFTAFIPLGVIVFGMAGGNSLGQMLMP